MTTQRPTRVLVVDDSAFARKVLRETLAVSTELEVVGIARDGLEALEKIAELKPDVVTLDLIMPNLDGLGVLRALPPVGAPRVVVVSISDGDSALGHRGAADGRRRPRAQADRAGDRPPLRDVRRAGRQGHRGRRVRGRASASRRWRGPFSDAPPDGRG